ncbi:MAG: amidohydrolase family protein [Acidobacteria bacterium]|nr:amidohydrolase family protein [Acidobacteriota bacterium]
MKVTAERIQPFLCALLLFIVTEPQPIRSQDIPPEVIAYPETIVFNGKILTVDNQFSIAQALAIRGDQILAVGDNARILRLAGPNTRRIDLRGKTVVPGFINTHYHQGGYAIVTMLLEEKGIDWEGDVVWMGLRWKDVNMALRDIRRAVEAARPGEIVRIPIFSRDSVLRDMTLQQLDAVSPQNPVAFVGLTNAAPSGGNTRVIELAKIPPGTPGLPGNRGVMISGQAGQILSDYLMWAIPLERLLPGHYNGMKLVNSWGLTTVVTRITPIEFNAIREIWLKGDLTLRWRVAFPTLVPMNVRQMGNVSDIGDDWLRISGARGGISMPGYTMPFQGHWSSEKGPANADEEAAVRTRWANSRPDILEMLKYGWSTPNTHIMGDIAVREWLNVIEESLKNPLAKSSNQRFTMDHMVEVDNRDIARMKRLGVQPSSLLMDLFSEDGSSDYQSVFGMEYVHRLLPLKKYIDAGIHPTIEADTGEPIRGEPLWMIEKAVCRCVDGSDRVLGRDQKVSREDGLRMQTIWSAEYVGDEKKLGSLEPGKLADLVVLDGDYMSVPEDRISDLKVVLTIVGGEFAYQDASGL